MVDVDLKKEIVFKILERGINEETLKEIDKHIEMIPITFDKIIKSLFLQNNKFAKMFISSVVHLDINPNDMNIFFSNSELPVTIYNEYKKVIDFNICINNMIHINLEVNRDYFKNVKHRNNMYFDKIIGLSLNTGDNIKKLENVYNIQLNLNEKEKNPKIGEDLIVPYSLITKSKYIDNKKIYVRYLDYYRNLYYNNVDMLEDELWLALLTSKNFYELNDILSKLVDDKLREKIVKDVIIMNMDYVIFF